MTIRDLDSKSGVSVNSTIIDSGKDIEITFDEEHLWATQDKRHVAGRGYGGWADINIGDKTNFRLERIDWSICSVGLTIQSKVGIVEMAAEMGKTPALDLMERILISYIYILDRTRSSNHMDFNEIRCQGGRVMDTRGVDTCGYWQQ